MSTCIKCGGSLGDFDAGGDMICDSCEARGSGSGGGTDVPCQRCGMYLPPHELQMWNSRLYCAYCIMDIKDEENYGRRRQGEDLQQVQNPMENAIYKGQGTCQRCGKSTDQLYTSFGMNLCMSCLPSAGKGGPSAGKPSKFGQIVTFVKKHLKLITLRPRAIAIGPILQQKGDQVFDLRGRMMKEKEGKGGSGGIEHKGKPSEGTGETAQPSPQEHHHPETRQPENSVADFSAFKSKTEPKTRPGK